MTSVSMDVVTDPSPVNTESAGVEDAESSQGGKPTQLESGHDLTAEEEALLAMLRNSSPDSMRITSVDSVFCALSGGSEIRRTSPSVSTSQFAGLRGG